MRQGSKFSRSSTAESVKGRKKRKILQELNLFPCCFLCCILSAAADDAARYSLDFLAFIEYTNKNTPEHDI